MLARLAFGDCTENEAYPSQEAKMFKSNLKLLFQVSHLTDSTEQVSVRRHCLSLALTRVDGGHRFALEGII